VPAKSTPTKYGYIAITLHWLMAVLILVLLGSGFRAAGTVAADAKAAILMVHAPVGISVFILLVLRVIWWLSLDKKPDDIGGQPRWQEVSAQAVHYAFYAVLFLMTASGIGMFILSGAGPILFGGGTEALPDFDKFAPRVPHGLGARFLIALVVLHAGAALYHQFIRKDGLLSRMWFGGD
jgi:cytochrome b561